MKRKLVPLLATASMIFLAGYAAAQQDLSGAAAPGAGFTSAVAKSHLARAMVIAGDDLKPDLARMCHPQRVQRMVGDPPPPGTLVPPPKPRPVRPAYEPNRIFDNVWYFGTSEVGSTVIRTSRGLVLIDALTTSEDAERVLVEGMLREHLDPNDIRYIIVTHAHGDHHGGIDFLRSRYPGFKIVMSADDWAFSTKPFFMPDGNPDTAPKLPRAASDIAYRGSYDLRLGDTKFHLIETPGHTPGTTGLIYNISSGGRTETVAQWGGGSPMDPLFSVQTVARFVQSAKSAQASIQWSSHTGPGFWGISGGPSFIEKLSVTRTESAGQNPFVIGKLKSRRFLDLLLECKRAAAADRPD